MRHLLTILALLLSFAVTDLVAAPVDFVRDVRPILQEHCYDCHGPEKQKSGLRLDIREAALKGGEYYPPNIIPGQPEESPLIHFIRGDDEEMKMPPKGKPIPPEQIATLTQWIEQGATWPDGVDLAKLVDKSDHWSFKPLATFDKEQSIDKFIAEKLRQNDMHLSPEADRLTWLRRVTFDLIGLPPTPDEVSDFLNDKASDAHQRVVDRLLKSTHYGERWAQHWLDVVRYADTHGFEVNTPRPNAWPYRDYVIEAFNRDLPYDQFIREQLAGDTLGQDAATGFLVTSAVLLPGQIGKDDESKRLARQDELGEIVINTGEAFLGLSIGCARCHDHKFDAISAKDYYSMQAFFAGVEYGDRTIPNPEADKNAADIRTRLRPIDRDLTAYYPVADSGVERAPIVPQANHDRFEPVQTKKVRFVINSTNKLEPCLDELEVFNTEGHNVAIGAKPKASGSRTSPNRHELRHINDGQFGNSRSWMSNEVGKGWVQLEFTSEHEIERVVWGRDRQGKFADRLPLDYRIEVEGPTGQWEVVATSSDRKAHDPKQKKTIFPPSGLNSESKAKAKNLLAKRKPLAEELAVYSSGGQMIYAGKFKIPEPMHLLNRGDPEQPKEEVQPAVLSALGKVALPLESKDQERRRALADWIAKPENPLTARVMVNRIWQGHFGIGLVETSNDFGRAGALPTHPELLDWLANEFIRSGWSVKHMHRLIILSDTYRQSSRIDPVAQAKDADVRLLWRFPSRRLEAETIRDSMLSVSGRLNLKAGGPGFNLFKSRGGTGGFPPIESFKGEGLRRMIYSHKVRMEQESIFGAFDCPDAGQSVSRRRQSTTPIQALNLFNSRFTIEESEAMAEHIEADAGSKPEDQVRLAYRLAFNREPDSQELADAAYAVSEHNLATLCRAIFNSNEFLFIP